MLVKENKKPPSREEIEKTIEIMEKIFYRTVKKGKLSSVDGAKTALFKLYEGVAEKLASEGFDGREMFPKNQEDVSDEKASSFLTDFDDYFWNIKVGSEVARRET